MIHFKMENNKLKDLNLKKRRLEKEIEEEQKRENFINNDLVSFNNEKRAIDESICKLKKEIETLETRKGSLLKTFQKICVHEDIFTGKNEYWDNVYKCTHCEREVVYGDICFG